MEVTLLQQLSTAVSMLLLLILVMKPKLRVAPGEPRAEMDQGEQDSRR